MSLLAWIGLAAVSVVAGPGAAPRRGIRFGPPGRPPPGYYAGPRIIKASNNKYFRRPALTPHKPRQPPPK